MQNLEYLLSKCYETLDHSIDNAWNQKVIHNYIESLVIESEAIANSMLEAGDFGYQKLNDAETQYSNSELIRYYSVNYLWIERAKSFLILWRDILFQAQKAQLLLIEKKADSSGIELLKEKSKNLVLSSSEQFKSFFEKEIVRITDQRKGPEKLISQWSLQQNPFPVYKEQLLLLVGQCRKIHSNYTELSDTSGKMGRIRQLINNTIQAYLDDSLKKRITAEQAIDFIENKSEDKVSRIVYYFEDVEKELTKPETLDRYSAQLNETTGQLSNKMQVSVSTREGAIQFKEINFQKSVSQWLESEIFPSLYQIEGLSAVRHKSLKLSLLNIRNRAVLLTNELKEGKELDLHKEDIGQPLKAFLEKNGPAEENMVYLKNQMDSRLDDSFGVFSLFYPNRNFLSLTHQSTIPPFRISRQKWVLKLMSFFRKIGKVAQTIRTNVEVEETLSNSEKIVRYIQSRTADEGNSHYSGIFLTKGYIGESFVVGRKKELSHIEDIINQWQQGFRGAVILSGQRFSGKSLFGDLVGFRFFNKSTIKLTPNSVIKIQGRQMTCGYDIGECLDFIRKYSIPQKVMVWIDDLELWSDPEHPLGQNVRSLCHYAENYSGQMFLLVSMSNWLKTHLNQFLEIHKWFHAEINLDFMALEEVSDAIMIRHGATHANMVVKEGKEASPSFLQKQMTKIHRSVEGNVGEALRKWSVSVAKLDDSQVAFQPNHSFGLPDFINPDTAIMLTTLMMEKRSNDYRLRKLFGPPFKDKYTSILQRLLNIGLLTRDVNGWIEVSEKAVNDIGRLLERREFLAFYHKK